MYYMGIDLHKRYFVSTIMDKQAVEKVIFFLRPVHGLTRAKYYPQACLKQTGLFLKNNKPKPFDGIIR
ncbi:MAG TPA: hypothetical protein ENJ03_04360, partial [Candidatus Desulfofervidus auxilii]|nr:hypothetical protein [Candidatus Desulfofervidus auxilii]